MAEHGAIAEKLFKEGCNCKEGSHEKGSRG